MNLEEHRTQKVSLTPSTFLIPVSYPRYYSPMIIMGVDPGSRTTGYGVIEVAGSHCSCLDFGCIVAAGAARKTLAERLAAIHTRLSALIEHHRPEVVAVEGVFHAANVKSALTLGHARGAILVAIAQHGVQIVEYSPMEIKKAVVGYGRAEKQQVQMMVQRILEMDSTPKPHDAADALAAALCRALSGPGAASGSSWRRIRVGGST